MRRGTFFFIQAVVSLIITSLIWYMTRNFLDIAMNDIEMHGAVVTDGTKSPFIVFGGGIAIYIILTIIYIIIGARHVQDWRPSAVVVCILIHFFMFIFGLFMPGIIEAVVEQLNTVPGLIQDLVDSITGSFYGK